MSNGIQLFSENNLLNQLLPSKLLKKYLECKSLMEVEGLQGQVEKVVLKEIENELLWLYNEKKLSHYHFAKLVLNKEEEIGSNYEKLITSIGIFKDEFLKHSDHPKIQKQAEKIANWAANRQELNDFSEDTIVSMEEKYLQINPYLWAFSIPYFAPLLSSHGPYKSHLTENTIVLIDQFIKTKKLPQLNENDLIKLIEETDHLHYNYLQRALEKELIKKISDHNILSVANLSLSYDLKCLMLNCSDYINQLNCGIQNLDLEEGKILITQWNENVESILETLKDYVINVRFSNSSLVTKALEKNIVFPKASSCTVFQASNQKLELDKISKVAPIAKIWKLDAPLYLNAHGNVISSLAQVESLQLIGDCPNIPTQFPPKLKLFIRNSKDFSIEKRKNLLLCSVGPIKLQAAELGEFGDQITDELFIKMVRTNPKLVGFEINSPHISDHVVRWAIQKLHTLKWIYLKQSKISEETVKCLAESVNELNGLKIACDHISEETLNLLSENFTDFFDLALYGCEFNENGVENIINLFKDLHQLELNKCKYTENLLGKIFCKYQKLEKLEFNELIFDKGEGKLAIKGLPISDELLKYFINKFNVKYPIRELILSQFNLGKDVMKAILERSTGLQIINLKNARLSDELVLELLHKASKLKGLNLCNSPISQKCFGEILEEINLQDLMALVLNCSNIGDDTLLKLPKSCLKLGGLKLDNYSGTEDNLITLVSNLKNLKNIEIIGREITSRTIEILEKLRPDCKFVIPVKQVKRLKLELKDSFDEKKSG